MRIVRPSIAALAALTFLAPTTAGAGAASPSDEIVIQVDEHGGFVPVEIVQGNGPDVTVYADGRVITPSARGRFDAMDRLRIARIDAARLEDLLDRARSIGLLDDTATDYGVPGVTDMTDTTVTITVDGEISTTSVYALSFDAADLTDEQQANREALRSFISEVASAAPRRTYRPSGLAVMVSRALDDSGGRVVDWPFDDLASSGEAARLGERCLVVSGDDLDDLWPLAKQARWSWRWHSGGEDYRLVFRPLLPHERTCEDIGAL